MFTFIKKKEDGLAVFILAAFCGILYFNSLWNVFAFDDVHSICDNLYIKDARYIPMFFKGYYTSIPDIPRGMFRPLLMLTFSFNYFFSGLAPLGYHIINILTHFLNGVLLYSILRFLKKDLPFGLVLGACLLFIAHPLNTEAVNYISCRSDLLVTFFTLAAVLLYLRSRPMLAVLLYILALLTKETALVFPFLALACDFIFLSPQDTLIKKIKSKAGIYLFVAALSVFYWVYKQAVIGETTAILSPLSSPVRSFYSNFLMQFVVSIFYLRLFILPFPLNLHHVFPEYTNVFSPVVFSGFLAVMALIALVFILRKKEPLISFGLAWYLICLLPKFYAVLNYPAMEHHFYLPGMGIYLALSGVLAHFYLKFRRKLLFAAFAVLSVFTLLVWFRNYEWKDALTLYKRAVERDPGSALAHNNLGIEYARIEMSEQAQKEFKKALSLSNAVDVQLNSRINLARIYSNQKKFKEAIEELNRAIEIKPSYSATYQGLGVVYTQMDDDEKAEAAWKAGLSFNPQAAGILENLGILYFKRGKLAEAEHYFKEAIRFQPKTYSSYFGLGQIYEQQQDPADAIKAYEKSLEFNPAFALSHYSLGTLYAQRQDKRALWHLKEAVRLKPDFADAHNNLAVLYASLTPPQLELARRHAKKALVLGYKVEDGFLKVIGLKN
ncbi:MAG: tetratricopeptide repeat protein [Candidatus Omnitrophica bacterium]|nr:tetratricopeptide repeat protein [Candidatus Omnitrophota bacterium]